MLSRILALIQSRGMSDTAFEKAVGLPKGLLYQWKSGRSKGYRKYTAQIADLFGVTADYLLTGKEEKAVLTPIKGNMQFIPLYNSVSAGFGACAVDLVEGYIPVYNVNAEEAENTIAITVHGNSMSPKIDDGDIIVVHKQDSVDSGTIAVVFLDGDAAMVKRVIYDKSHIELQSLNPDYSPMVFTDSEVLRVRVVGRVVEVHKKL